ncbi:glycoside hydrolase family 16 protein [Hypoxylon trugodes]|uniref:glycoside hydrolase family 16 protein n=1 Tax=Hypoxylon trugodes TaxID=326681 RepID=UPI002190FAEB|nr:glycoside hydrolase family 16 protein [Hypoxylon trugodes]KAI1392626.1 glycoside hydrolase family 16 protein [Hypoxylon trugodes]
MMEPDQVGSSSFHSTALPTPQQPGTPSTDRSPGEERADTQFSRRADPINPFTSPSISRPESSIDSSDNPRRPDRKPYFRSRRIKKGEVEKPWLAKKEPREKWVVILPVSGLLIGLALSGFFVWDGIHSVVKHNYCLVLEDNFSTFNDAVWTKEVQVGGFGNGEFEQTTGDDENVFIKNGHLFIKPTLQDANLVEKDSLINLLEDGTCTSTQPSDCIAATNTTVGNATIVPPTKSGRIHTKKGATIKYGRVEVTAKLPQGDWLWPAIWMMPVNDTYGPWPASGEIDIMESRGNNWTYGQGGNDIVSSALHWGPDPNNDAWWKTNVKRKALHTTYSAGFNTYGVEWSQKYIFTYVNSRLLQVLYTNFDQPLFQRGNFPEATANGTRLMDTWSVTGRFNTPFDQNFYLILNVAVGGTNGWFEDAKSGKPWIDISPNAKKDFWNSQNSWFPTWVAPAMEVSKVVMLQQCDGDEQL